MIDPRTLYRECRSKLAWSHKHLHDLDVDIARFVQGMKQGETYDIVTDRDSAPGYHIERLRVLQAPPTIRWRLMAGDVVHNARSTLDNLIEALTILHHGRPVRGTAFPIFIDEDSYFGRGRKGKSGVRQVRRLKRPARTIIENAQPYKAGHFHIRHALWTLNELWNADKHRSPAVVAFAGHTLSVGKPQFAVADGGVGTLITEDGLIESTTSTSLTDLPTANPQTDLATARFIPFVDGAEIGRSQIRGSNLIVVVQAEIAFRVAFEPTAPGFGQDVVILLAQCLDAVSALLRQFRPEFR